ncbi:MAG: hypothetical protein RR752_00400, partial [Mucinivorans sp.]
WGLPLGIEMWATADDPSCAAKANRSPRNREVQDKSKPFGASGASEQIAVQAPCRIVTFEKVTQNFLAKNFVFLNQL